MSKPIDIIGIPVHPLSYEGVLSKIQSVVIEGDKKSIVTVNPEMILKAYEEDSFFNLLESSFLNTADGIGVLWAGHYLSLPKKRGYWARIFQLLYSLFKIPIRHPSLFKKIPQRITGSDLMPRLIKLSEEKGWKIFLLGSAEGVAKKAVKNFKLRYPNAHFVGSYSGSPDIDEEVDICDLINKAKPDLLFVAYGSPAQEYWIHRNLFKLRTVKLAIGVGGTFDFYAGKVRRAPMLFRRLGLEWLWRLMMEPSRTKRIWRATYKFIRLVHRQKYVKIARN